MELTILYVGEAPVEMRQRVGRFPPWFQETMGTVEPGFRWREVRVVDGEPLPDPHVLDAAVITGSAFGVKDDTPWIDPLRRFVRDAYAHGTKLVGICFGHQMIAHALGGDVRRAPKGWGIGLHHYDVVGARHLFPEGLRRVSIPVSHQDQVIAPPADATPFLRSSFTPYAGLTYRNGAVISVQGHPEFDVEAATYMCELRRDNPLSPQEVEQAIVGLSAPFDNAVIMSAIARFLKG